MLISLHVKNLALIEEAEVWFGEGLNILTGETGAGKSVIIGSIGLALGAKAEKDLIRTGCEYGLAELVFLADRPEQIAGMKAMELPLEEDGTVLITRRIMQGRSVSRVNGENVTTKQLRELASLFLDIHGQHEHQSLLHQKKHLEVLDAYAGKKLEPVLLELKESYDLYQQLRRELEETDLDENARRKELSLAQFELKEIEEARLYAGEDEKLEADFRRMSNLKRIGEAVAKAHEYMTGDGSGTGAGEQTGRALRELMGAAGYDEGLQDLTQQLADLENLMNDFNRDLSGYMADLVFDESDFVQTQQRLDEVNRLKDKYGPDVEQILAYAQQLQEKCEKLLDYDACRQKLEAQAAEAQEALCACSQKTSAIRQKAARELERKMKETMLDLNFLDVAFEVAVRPQEGKYRADGYDDVEFLVSTNPGEPVKPLGNVASGGELSRIMLAVKTVLADRDATDTLIFDEIDAGISGKTAWKVSEKLAVISRAHQVICITHLPQIAAMADTHFVIEKITEGKNTFTQIRRLQKQEEVEELARLLGGDKPSESAYENARELKKQAAQAKIKN